jgi:hypothetical protein
VDLDDEGFPQLRSGFTTLTALTSGLNVFAGAGLLLLQDNGVIYSVNPSTGATTSLVTGLSTSARVEFHEHAGQIFWTNGVVSGRISSGSALNWGLTVCPSPTLDTTPGTLRAGRYMVAATFVDASGVEHAAGKASVIEVDGTEDIIASIGVVASAAVSIRFYCTKPNGKGLFYVGQALVGDAQLTISDVEVSEEPLRTQFLYPPIPGSGIFSYRGYLMTFVDNAIFPSHGVNYSLFDVMRRLETRPTDVRAGAGLRSGFWTVCERGAFWTTGEKPEDWRTVKLDDRKYAAGTVIHQGHQLPALEVVSDFALFVSEDGLMAGLEDGRLRSLTQDRLYLDVEGKRAQFALCRNGDLRQVLFNLESI